MSRFRKINFSSNAGASVIVGGCLLISSTICKEIVLNPAVEKICTALQIASILIMVYFFITIKRTMLTKKIQYVIANSIDLQKYTPVVSYRDRKEIIEVKIKLSGAKNEEKLCNLEEEMQHALGAYVLRKKIEVGLATYQLAKKSFFRPITCEKGTNYENLFHDTTIVLTEHLSWNYAAAPHCIITAGTGGGKSYLGMYILKTLCVSKKADVFVMDPKNSDIARLGRGYNVPVAVQKEAIIKSFQEVVEIMNVRYKDMDSLPIGSDFYSAGLNPIFVIFDEVAAFFATTDKKERELYLAALRQIVLKGRQAGCILIVMTQRGDADCLGGGAVRDQFCCRIGLGRLTPDGKSMVFGEQYRNYPMLLNEPGEGMILIDGEMDNPQPFKAPRLKKSFFII